MGKEMKHYTTLKAIQRHIYQGIEIGLFMLSLSVSADREGVFYNHHTSEMDQVEAMESPYFIL